MDAATLRLREGVTTWTATPDETLLLDLQNAQYLGVNHAGSLLWSMLVTGTTREALIARLREEYELDEVFAARDVDAFLDQCTARGYLG